MPTYPNGKIPDRLLVRRGDFLLTAGTWAKFDDFSSRIKRRTGVTLTIPSGSFPGGRGEGAFRTYAMQVAVKNYWVSKGQGRMAAAPGYSSHGGEFNGQDALAIDIDNYARVPLSIFFEEGRAAGFQMGYFDGRGGRPYEPWHIIDRDPYRVVAGTAGSGASTPAQTPVQEDDMRTIKSPNRPWANVGPGYHRQITDEAAANTIWPKMDLNDRQYDLAVEAATGNVRTQPAGGAVIIEDDAKQRPVALIGAGYYRALNSEELANAGILADRRVVGNTRQYDLWVSIALAGDNAVASGLLAEVRKVTAGDVNEQALAESIASLLASTLGDSLASTVLDSAAKRLAD